MTYYIITFTAETKTEAEIFRTRYAGATAEAAFRNLLETWHNWRITHALILEAGTKNVWTYSPDEIKKIREAMIP